MSGAALRARLVTFGAINMPATDASPWPFTTWRGRHRQRRWLPVRPRPSTKPGKAAWRLSSAPSAVRPADILDQPEPRRADHIALRSFVDSSGRSGLAFLDFAFTSFGYKPEDDITIPNLPVNARWYEPPASTGWPKIFVSELRSAELPPVAAEIVFKHVDGYFASGPKSSDLDKRAAFGDCCGRW